jgi:hypothetical protein
MGKRAGDGTIPTWRPGGPNDQPMWWKGMTIIPYVINGETFILQYNSQTGQVGIDRMYPNGAGTVPTWRPTPKSPAVFTGGYYNLDIPGLGWAQHTYVIANRQTADEVLFPCYGGTDPEHKLAGSVYPAMLYKPYIWPPYTEYGYQTNGDLWLARAIACGDPGESPRANYDKKIGGKYLFGDCCGLIYALNGVCHHMEARILWSCNNMPIIWPPTVSTSYWVWMDWIEGTGFHGNTWHLFKKLFEKFKEMPHMTNKIKDIDIAGLMKQGIRESIENIDTPEHRKILEDSIAARIGANAEHVKIAPVVDKMMVFLKFKSELDQQLLKGIIDKQKYTVELNQKYAAAIADFANMMDAKSLMRALNVEPNKTPDLGINSDLIPDNLSDFELID